MKKLIFLLLGTLISFYTFAQDFTYEYEGQTLTYAILSETDKTCKVVTYDDESTSGKVIIPPSVVYEASEYTVTTIANSAFSYCYDLISVIIPSTVTEIGDFAFFWCNHMTSVDIPSTVTTIGEAAFRQCRDLESITIPADVTSIGMYAFYGCDHLFAIHYNTKEPREFSPYIFDNATYIMGLLYVPEEAIEICKKIEPWKNFKMDYSGSFYYTTQDGTKLKYAVLSETDKTCMVVDNDSGSIYYRALIIPSFVKNESVEYKVVSIGEYALRGCFVPTVVLPNTITSIEDNAFYSCDLKTIVIPASVKSIGEGAFSYCRSLTSIDIPESVISIGNSAFYNCTDLVSIELPASVELIGNSVFESCTDLLSVKIPKSVTTIGERAFYRCGNLSSVEIPNSVTSIGDLAFYGCTGLTSVYYKAEDPVAFSFEIFDYRTYTSATLYVPETAKEKCSNIVPWKNFKTIQQFDGVDDITVDVDMTSPCEVYAISGVKVADSTEGLAPGLYIVRQGSTVKKIRIN